MDYDFTKCLKVGQRGEQLIMSALIARGHKITDLRDDATARFNDIDLLLDNGTQQTYLEVKNDMRSETTGNVFVETYNINNINHLCKGWFFYCQANYIAFVQETKRKAHIISLEELKETIEYKDYREAKTANSNGYLVPIGDLEKMKSYFLLEL